MILLSSMYKQFTFQDVVGFSDHYVSTLKIYN